MLIVMLIVGMSGISSAMISSRSSIKTNDKPFIEYRIATRDDIAYARTSLLENLMNPISLSEKHLLCAYDKEKDELLGFCQIRPIQSSNDSKSCSDFELASLFVKRECRSKGIGSGLVREILQKFDASHKNQAACVYLLTLRPTIKFYEPFGFKVLEGKAITSIPQTLQLELAAGTIISSILGNQIVCMCCER